MRKVMVILSLSMLSFTTKAQIVFKTEVPQLPVTAGESFRVQYLIKDVETEGDLTAPRFTGFRLVNGPDVYHNDGSKSFKNVVYTLVAMKPGRFIIHGATAKVNGRVIKSDDVVVVVIPKTTKEENVSGYFLQPGEDPYEKMRQNLFMKVMVDKRSCYVGEPVVASFKLYSRLQSKSDIVKNPGFYGFSVQDMVSLEDNLSNTETLDGKTFDVHTVRNVQLYPLQAGMFMIDAMEVLNKVEFSKSVVNKKTEQEIKEGVLENNNENQDNDNNTITYENSISSEKIAISVKPHPAINKPADFTGATGRFSIRAVVEKNDLAKNEEGKLIITIEGKGNFTQLSGPAIQWPGDMEGFDATIKDSLDKTHTPLKGTKTFCFPFVVAKAGTYIIPAVSLSFFDTDSNKYKTASAFPVEIRINEKESSKPSIVQGKKSKANNPAIPWWAGGGVLVMLMIVLLWFNTGRRKKEIVIKAPSQEIAAPVVHIEQLLQPVQFSLKADDGRFYQLLQKSIWNHLSIRLQLSGSKMNKDELYKAMKEKKLDEGLRRDILDILQQCEAAVFTKAEFAHDKQGLFDKAKKVLELITV